MGRIADAGPGDIVTPMAPFENKVDQILEGCDDDEDRAIVLSWLVDLGAEEAQAKLLQHGITVATSTIRLWRRHQTLGLGRRWVA